MYPPVTQFETHAARARARARLAVERRAAMRRPHETRSAGLPASRVRALVAALLRTG